MRLVLKYLSSAATSLVLLSVYAIGLAMATFIEKYYGTAVAKAMVYYSPLFFLLQLLMVINFIIVTIRRKMLVSGRWGLMVTHLALIVILAGATVSHLFGEEGILHLRQGEVSDRIMVRHSNQNEYHKLPFSVELVKFTLTRYPGSASPSSYESELLVHVDGVTKHARVYMNNVLDVKGYRFFQASYDQDEQGTVLSVNRDVAGRNITYTGYMILMIGFILCLTGRGSRLATLSRRLRDIRAEAGRNAIVSLLLLLPITAPEANAEEGRNMLDVVSGLVVSPEHAAKFGALPVQSSNGRMLPINTFSSELLRKLHKSDKFGNMNSDQFLLSLLAMPDMWARVPLISLSNSEIANYFDITEGEFAFTEIFDSNGQYKLQDRLDEAYGRIATERTRFDKDLIKLDEQVNIFHQLITYQMLNIFPKEDDPDNRWYAPGDDLSIFSGKDSMFVAGIMSWYISEVQYGLKSGDWSKADEVVGMISTYQQAKSKGLDISPKKMSAEIRYNELDIFVQCKRGYLILGGLLLALTFSAMFRRQGWMAIASRIISAAIFAVFAFHIYGMGMRWYIAGYAPWSNSYETMVYVSWATVLGGLLFMRKSVMTFALATLFGGIILFVSGLSWMDPQINPLVPVLKSPWLMFHVAVIVAAYGFFGISALIGITNMSLICVGRKQTLGGYIKELTIINEMSLWLGLWLMTIGTFLGAVWANESWGRYWGWDPKETWALITMVIYAIVSHMRMVPRLAGAWLFNFSSVVAFYSVLMTFFGVNYFLSGMHSYGQNDNVNGIFIYLYMSIVIVALLGLLSYRKRERV